MHMNPDHDGSKTGAIGASVETVENIDQANEKNHATIAIANIAIMLIKRKEYNKVKDAHEPWPWWK